MACRKIVLNGPFYLNNKDNKKYPQNTIENETFGPAFLKEQFWKNETFMTRVDRVQNHEAIENILRNEIASLGMNMDNFYRYNFDEKVMEKIEKQVAFGIILKLVKKNYNDRKRKRKNQTKQIPTKPKLDSSVFSTATKKTCVRKSNTDYNPLTKETMSNTVQLTSIQKPCTTKTNIDSKHLMKQKTSNTATLMDNIHHDIVIQKGRTLRSTLYDSMLPFTIDKTNSPNPTFDTSCEAYEMYSMIHNVFEDFNFCVYNGSHKSINQVVHRSSMSNLYFPADVGMFILFHGALIHSGAPSKPDKNINSFNYSADVRFHLYIQKEGIVHDPQISSTKRQSNRKPSLSRYRNHSIDPSAGSSMRFCDNLMEVRKNIPRKFECEICNNALSSLTERYPIVNRTVSIDMSMLYDKACRLNPLHPTNEPLYIAGDLEKYGWVVYSGYQLSSLRRREKLELREELMNFIHCGKGWREPQTNRLVCSIDSMEAQQSFDKIKRISEFYNHMLHDCLRKIPLFSKAVMTERYIIRNNGLVLEQKPHRDFEYKVKEN